MYDVRCFPIGKTCQWHDATYRLGVYPDIFYLPFILYFLSLMHILILNPIVILTLLVTLIYILTVTKNIKLIIIITLRAKSSNASTSSFVANPPPQPPCSPPSPCPSLLRLTIWDPFKLITTSKRTYADAILCTVEATTGETASRD